VPGQTETETFITGSPKPSPRAPSRNDSAVRSTAGKPMTLLEILDTATNTRDAPTLGI
jgi:hypothetical protein